MIHSYENKPADIQQNQGDGFYYSPTGQRVCEDCWQPIPSYVDFPQGLTSPESDGDPGGNFAKRRTISIEGSGLSQEQAQKALQLMIDAQRLSGLTASPEQIAKMKEIFSSGVSQPKSGNEPLRKAVCLPCYITAFEHTYPNAERPTLSPLIRTSAMPPDPPEPEHEYIFVPEPKEI
jgi:hypothetical protein